MAREIEVVAALVSDHAWTGFPLNPEARYLVGRRVGSSHAGRWEFPGGKVEPGETQPAALVREIREELGVQAVLSGGVLVGYHHRDPGFPGYTVWLYPVRLLGTPRAQVHDRLAYVTLAEAAALPGTPSMPTFLGYLRQGVPPSYWTLPEEV